MFINREKEIGILKERYDSNKFEFVSIIGRRRTGKTTLIKKFLDGKKDSLYFYIPYGYEKDIKLDLVEELISNFNISFLREPSWKELFEKIFEHSRNKRMILVFDEFQRFLKINISVPSILQGIIDDYKDVSGLFLIAVGSSIGMMNSLFDYTSPLYGRRTARIDISPFDYQNMRKYIEEGEEEKINVYSIYGGTPKYLEIYKEEKTRGNTTDLMNIIENTILKKDSFLYNEPILLLKTELKESEEYFSILKAISSGKCTFNEIGNSISVDKNTLSYYLNTLKENLDLVERIVPSTEKPEKSKKGRYVIKDIFFRFWFKFVLPNMTMLELENTKPVVMKINKELNAFVGFVFEDVVRELIVHANKRHILVDGCEIPLFSNIGAWWDRKGNEIDICAVSYDKKEILLGEVKWRNTKSDVSDIQMLIDKSSVVPYDGKKILLFTSKSGFTEDAKEFMKGKGILSLDLKDIEEFYDNIK